MTVGFKDAFARYASSIDRSPPVALKAIVQQIVTATRVEPEELDLPKATVMRSERLIVHFSKEELDEIRSRVQDFGSVRDWLAALARAQIAPDVAQFSRSSVGNSCSVDAKSPRVSVAT